MSLVYTFLADSCEEVEALSVVDVLRRAGIEVVMVSVTGNKMITGSHKIKIEADALYDDVDINKGDMLFLPGGMPGTLTLKAHEGLKNDLLRFNEAGKKLAAICAAPSVLGELSLLKGKKATCYPGFEDKLLGADYTGDIFETDGNVTTGRGMGVAVDFGLELVRVLAGEGKAAEIKESIQM